MLCFMHYNIFANLNEVLMTTKLIAEYLYFAVKL